MADEVLAVSIYRLLLSWHLDGDFPRSAASVFVESADRAGSLHRWFCQREVQVSRCLRDYWAKCALAIQEYEHALQHCGTKQEGSVEQMRPSVYNFDKSLLPQ